MLRFKNTCLPTGKKGFTLIELLIVIVIIGFLATMIMINIGTALSKSRDAKRQSDLKQMSTALELYYQDENSYPLPADEACVSTETGANGCWPKLIDSTDIPPLKKYIPLVPRDPKNESSYIYKYCNVGGTKFVIVATLENKIPEPQQLGKYPDCTIRDADGIEVDAEHVFWVGN